MTADAWGIVRDALDAQAATGRVARFWLRDDDAVGPSPALDRLMAFGERTGVPMTLAVIPRDTGAALAARLADAQGVTVAVHGWAHANHAPPGRKNCELGEDRAAGTVLGELGAGLAKLAGLHGDRCLPVLVPPWNRIAPVFLRELPGLGFRALSAFGDEERGGPIRAVNTHVDLIDWRGTRAGRQPDALAGDIARRLAAMTDEAAVGILAHHLAHDDAAWNALDRIAGIVAAHPAAHWAAFPALR